MRKKVLVLGSNFGGLTAALAVKHELGGDVDVTVVAPDDQFLFTPSLIWLPFGKRERADITFPVEPTLDAHGIGFEHDRRHRSRPHRPPGDPRRRAAARLRLRGRGDRLPQQDRRGPRVRRQRGHHHDAVRGRTGRRGLDEVPGVARGRGDRRHPGRRLLRGGLRVPVQHLPPAPEGRPAQAGQADLRDGRAVPRPLRDRRAAARRAAARHVPQEGGHRGPDRHRDRPRRRRGAGARRRRDARRSPSAWSCRRSSGRSSCSAPTVSPTTRATSGCATPTSRRSTTTCTRSASPRPSTCPGRHPPRSASPRPASPPR